MAEGAWNKTVRTGMIQSEQSERETKSYNGLERKQQTWKTGRGALTFRDLENHF